ncbi:cation:proton antiporter [Streptomyces lonarensis]|uniref:Monovalent cation/H(+) antiporter subunit G n=1 Tax=Streptomyces lonarensis TaxID=700599 RepID=A0A7X6CXY7_9ACTN|nr:monovalent cation/H(+) antiporter subunit G [Streptomyces lonarensis]NJQ04629.1 monovalent cation/H(+) antiporter subunit G [Streptomyces lonarensis]
MTGFLDPLGQAMAVLGGLVFVAAGVGLLRLRDPYMRTSAVATAAGVGVVLVVGGSVLTSPADSDLVKLAVAVVLQLATSAVGGMTLARAAVLSGHDFADGTDTSALDQPERSGD